jgi:hypothetical protein
MEMDPEMFEKLTVVAQNEEKVRVQRAKDIESKWTKLEAKFGK